MKINLRLHDSLEIGAGSGLVGLAVAKGSVTKTPLWITDQVEMESLMRHNIELNGLQTRVKATVLNWYVRLPSLSAGPRYLPVARLRHHRTDRLV